MKIYGKWFLVEPANIRKLPPDVIIRCDHQEFPVHKAVLVQVSDFFLTMFTSQLPEATAKVILLRDIPADTFQLILDVIYENRFPEIDNVQDYRTFRDLLDYFQIELTGNLFALCHCPNSMLLELIDEIPDIKHWKQPLGTGPMPKDLVLELYRRKIISDDEIYYYLYEKFEDPVDTLIELWQLGFDEKLMVSIVLMWEIQDKFKDHLTELDLPFPDHYQRLMDSYR